jgi:hypothetical protein
MDQVKKTSLEEAKINFEQIKKFAIESAKQEFEKEINEKVDKILKESLSIDVDDEKNITVTTDEKVIEVDNSGEVEVEEKQKNDEEQGLENFEDDNEEISIDNNIEETMYEEQMPTETPQVPAAPEVAANPEETPVEATEEAPVADDAIMKLAQDFATLINAKIDEKMGNAPANQGVDVDYIDDETNVSNPEQAPTAAPVAPAPAANQPIQEDLLEFSLEELNNEAYELYDDKGNVKSSLPDEISLDEDAIFEIEGLEEDVVFEIEDMEEDKELEEMKGVSKPLRNTSNRLGLEPREGTPSLNESINKIKALYESKLDELKKENKRLSEANEEFGNIISDYQDSFKGLRKQFDEMQTFNAKLAYANKIFTSGGLSISDKMRIAEEFDKTQTVDEAKKLYSKILEENKISINKDNASKIKASTTNSIKAQEVIYESADMKRRKVLAGIEKNEDYL